MSYGQFRSDPIRVQDITIRRPVLTVEQANGQFNFKALMEQMTPRPEQQRAACTW